MVKYIVSACLAGVNCKYSGGNNLHPKVVELLKKGEAVLVCPEQMGGLATPRIPAEITGDKVINKAGEDVTLQFSKGAQIALQIAEMTEASAAIFKERSPSCGVSQIYDGTHSGNLTKGEGLTTQLLRKHGIKVISEEELDLFFVDHDK